MATSKINLLFVSIAFPPKKDPECIQTARYFKYLSQNENLIIEVVTGKPPVLNMPLDTSLVKYDTGYQEKHEISIYENRYWNFLRRKLGIYFKPDTKWRFYKNIASSLKTRSVAAPDIIYSRSYPLSSAFAAHCFAKKFQKPWIMHLSDPWLYSPLHNYSRRERAYIEKWEDVFFQDATLVTFTSELTVEKYQNAYPRYAHKFQFLPNVYDDEDASLQSKIAFGKRIRVVYTGGIIGDRNPLPLFRALEMLSSDERDWFEFIFVGDADRSNRQLLENVKFSCVKYLGLKDLATSLELQRSANLLFLIDNKFDRADEALYFPSKLLDYIIQKKKILAITTKNGTTDRIIKNLGLGDSFGHNQVEEMAEFLRQTISYFKGKNLRYFCVTADTQKYAASQNASHLYSLIQKYA